MKASVLTWNAVKSSRPWLRVRTVQHDHTVRSLCTNATSARSSVNAKSLTPTPTRNTSTHARHVDPTIYALSTAPGRAAIAIIRISGPACLDIYRALCPSKKPPKPRYATVRTLYDPHGRTAGPETVLDASALVLYFPAPRTATGEDLLELHVHGGPAVVKAVLGAIPRCLPSSLGPNRIRYAEPGEFTRRAFMNDRLDLTQVEALGDILSATTEQQRRLSVRGTGGGLAKRYEEWRQLLLYARGELEALIDFSEDQHFDESPSELCASVAAQVNVLRRTLDVHRRNAVRGELLRNGISLALLGAPNAGKSSLLNRIVGREAAIVSAEKGTTRDVVEVGIDLGGYLCRLGDTAGLRTDGAIEEGGLGNAIGDVEREGMRRAKARAAESDVVIVVLSLEDMDGSAGIHLDAEIVATAAELIRMKDNVLVVVNKTDKIPTSGLEDAMQQIVRALPGLARDRIHPISCKAAGNVAGDYADLGGIQTFLAGLIAHFHDLTTALSLGSEDTKATTGPDASIWQDSLGATERHRLLLEECVSYLDAFLAEVHMSRSELAEDPKTSASEDDSEADIVVAAEHLRGAADCLARITGRGEAGDVEEVLGVVFEKFCVGK
ncbi:mitochondrial splicing system protein [Elasticomyces elasticus]|nr:mitochondrial splicing system protein [Elasticomyces elasticus]